MAHVEQFEAGLVDIEAMICRGVPFEEVFRAAIRSLHQICHVTGGAAWVTRDSRFVRILATGDCAADASSLIQQLSDHLTEHQESAFVELNRFDVAQEETALLTHVRLSKSQAAAFEIRFQNPITDERFLRDATAAVADCLADVFRRTLLESGQLQLRVDAGLFEMIHALEDCDTTATFLHCLAAESQTLLQARRASIIECREAKCSLHSISGLDTRDTNSPASRAVTDCAESLLKRKQTDSFVSLAQFDEQQNVCEESIRYLRVHGTEFVQLILIGEATESLQYGVLCEYGSHDSQPDAYAVQQFGRHIARIIERRDLTNPSWLKRMNVRRSTIATIILAVAAILLSVPADFEIEVSGQLYPSQRYNVFAPDDGIIEDLRVRNESTVTRGSDLLTIQNPDLDLQLQATIGSLQTEQIHLRSIQRMRSGAFVRASEGSNTSFHSSENAVEQRIGDLKARKLLLEAQKSALRLQAEVDGTIFRADLTEELSARPVRRGDFLFEVVPQDSEWMIELQIPDDVVGYVQKSRQSDAFPRVRYALNMSPTVGYTTQLSSIEKSVGNVGGKLICRGEAPAVAAQTVDIRPGTTVTARIHCGRRALGFIVFRELLEFGAEQRFAWF